MTDFQLIQDLQENLAGTIAVLVCLAVVSIVWLIGLTICLNDLNDSQVITNLNKRAADAEEASQALSRRVTFLEAVLPDEAEENDQPRHTVLSAVEEAIREMESVENWREEMTVKHGQLSPEMEELFAAYRRQVRDRRLTQLDRELAEIMGTEAYRGA